MVKKNLWALAALLLVSGTGYAQDYQQSYDLDETVVYASRTQLPLKKVPQKVEILSSEQIKMSPALNAADLLKNLVNLDIVQYPGASAQVSLRGYQPVAHNRNYTLLLIDGKPAGTTNLATIPSAFIDRIEIVKGPYSVVYGSDAMGGVINVITKKPTDERQGSFNIGVGNFARSNVSGYATGRLSDAVNASIGFSRNAQDKDYRIGKNNLLGVSELEKNILDEKSYGDVMGNSKYSIHNIMGKLDIQISDRWSALLSADYTGSEDIETPGNYWHSYGLSKQDFSRLFTSLDIKRQSHNNTLVIAPYFSTYSESNYNNNQGLKVDENGQVISNTFVDSKETQRQYGISLTDSHRWEQFMLLGGIDVKGNDIISQRFGDKITAIVPYRPDHSIFTTALFAQGTYSTEKLFLNAGMRVDYTRFTMLANEFLKNEKKSSGYFNFTPSFGAKYFITPMINLHGSIGTAFFLPDAYKVAGSYEIVNWKGVKVLYKGNPDLKPEKALSFDLGLGVINNDYISADVTYFQSNYRDRTVADNSHAPEYSSYKNANSGLIQGLEMMASLNMARVFGSYDYDLRLYANFTHLFKNTFTETDMDGNKLTKDMPRVRRTTGNFGISYNNHDGFTTSLNARYIGHRIEENFMYGLRPNITDKDFYAKGGYTGKEAYPLLQHPKHLIFDFATFYNVTKNITVGVQVNNLFDENYNEKDGYNMPGRNLMGSVSFNF